MTTPEWLKVAAERSAQDPASLGYIFEQYRKHEGKSAEELAAMLNCSPKVLDELSLCRRPEPERFAEHLRMIEKRFAVDPRRLAAVLRRVEVLDILPEDEEGGSAVRDDSYLLAARDRSSDDETSS
jgi:transcriptional regulator with XRE-family HTH domain